MGICTSKANRNEYSKPNIEKRTDLPHLSAINDNSDYDISKGAAAVYISNPLLLQPKFKRSHSTKINTINKYKPDIRNYDSKRLVIAYINYTHNINGINNQIIPTPIYELILEYYWIKYKVYAIPHNTNPLMKFEQLKSVENKIKSIENIYSLNSQYIIKSGNQMYNLSLLKNDKLNDSNYKTHFEQTPNIQLVASGKNQTFIKFQNKSIYTTEKVYSSNVSSIGNKTITIFNKNLYKLSTLWFNTKKENIISIECGRQHTLLLTESGRVYSMGNNDKGQCGLGGLMVNTFITQPTLITKFITENIKIKSISCGEQSSCCVDKTQKYLWCWGDTIAYSNDMTNGYMSAPNICLLSMINNANINVIKAKCNGNTTVAMDDKGYCYVLGGMMCGRSRNRLNTNIKFKDFDIGFDHIIFISFDENIYKLMYNNGAYNLYKLGHTLFPNLKSDCVVYSAVIASDSTMIIFH